MLPRFRLIAVALAGAAVLSACGASGPHAQRAEPDMQAVADALDCPSFSKPSCVARSSGPYRCSCMDDDALRSILEPEQ